MPCLQPRRWVDQVDPFAASTLVGAMGFGIGVCSCFFEIRGGPLAASCRVLRLLDHVC